MSDLQEPSQPAAPETPESEIEVRLSPEGWGLSGTSWGLRAWCWEQLVKAGVPLRPGKYDSELIPARGTLYFKRDDQTGDFLFRWSPKTAA